MRLTLAFIGNLYFLCTQHFCYQVIISPNVIIPGKFIIRSCAIYLATPTSIDRPELLLERIFVPIEN